MKIPKFDGSSSERSVQRGMLIGIISCVLVVIFVGYFLRIIFSDESEWKVAEFEQATKTFEENIMLARVEWMRSGRPAEIELLYAEWNQMGRPEDPISGSVRVLMSRDGWPLAGSSGAEGCSELWYLLARTDAMDESMDISYHQQVRTEYCEFYFLDKLRFTFYPANGRVVTE